ncbi:MAG: phospholipase D/Transphosphatidylase, partial [Mycobacterium sp.]|nr:phospholipase D/Transphosphatidylase [Mycobacterium sp.]
ERGGKTLPGPNQVGTFLRYMVRIRRDLDIHLLRSNMRLVPAFDGLWGYTPVTLMNRLTRDRLQFAVDGVHPVGSVPHQKIVIVDDKVAFCGGIDLTVERWDTRAHEDHNDYRRALGQLYGPRHDVAMAVDGDAARALAEHARDRWRAATGVELEPVVAPHVVWPRTLQPTVRDVEVGIARTKPEFSGQHEVREIESLNLAALATARHTIYLENQYLASRKLVEVLAVRLQDVNGPEIVVVMPRNSESRLEEQAMDSARYRLLRVLWAADRYERLGVYWPVTEEGTPIYVHSKVLVADDQLLRIGSSNLNNRSLGFDSECDLAIEAHPDNPGLSEVITAFRNDLVGEHLGISGAEFGRAIDEHGSFLSAIAELRGQGRTLRRFTESTVADEASPLAENDLMDPDRVPTSVVRSIQRWIARLND